ncbi:DUF350 domain-containing protein [Rosistilla oblonga]|uniref:DUF350 domain-containing protein n=1 Tax=Rosistilla oblonga TaxID=2527990 RepID=UPI0011A0393D|nr:DUF350 domain-containing protein [Rosistilla oblonga]
MHPIFEAYLITFGWAITGAISMGMAIIIAVRLFDLSTGSIDEWEELKKGNMAVAIVLSAVILAVGYVVGSAVAL